MPNADLGQQAAALQRHFAGLMSGRIVCPHESLPAARYLPGDVRLRITTVQKLGASFAKAKAGLAHGPDGLLKVAPEAMAELFVPVLSKAEPSAWSAGALVPLPKPKAGAYSRSIPTYH